MARLPEGTRLADEAPELDAAPGRPRGGAAQAAR